MFYFNVLNVKDIGLDIQDSMGRHEVGFIENTNKIPINQGNGCIFTSSFRIAKVRKFNKSLTIFYNMSLLFFSIFYLAN